MSFHESVSETHEPFFAVGKSVRVKALRHNVRDHCGKGFLRDHSARGVNRLDTAQFAFSERVRFRGEEPQSDDITMLAFCRTHSTSVAQPTSTARTSS